MYGNFKEIDFLMFAFLENCKSFQLSLPTIFSNLKELLVNRFYLKKKKTMILASKCTLSAFAR